MNSSFATVGPPLAQVEIRDRSSEAASCVRENGTFCFDWAADNFDRYVTPLFEHLLLVAVSVVFGFLIAFGMALVSHRRRWLVPTFTGATGILYTIPSLAFFFLLLPITGRGRDTAIIALTAYTLQIIYRNIVVGLNNVPEEAKDAGRGMGMTNRQLLWRVELPLSVPEIVAGLRIATVSTVAIATLAVFAGGGGLGAEIYADIDFKTNVIIAGGLAVLMAITFDLLLVILQGLLTPWRAPVIERETKATRFLHFFRSTAKAAPP
jgi:osmoprotectant transport system permease protein